MKRTIEFDITGATDKTCGTCPHRRRDYCLLIPSGLLFIPGPIMLQNAPGGKYKRDPECIKAERKG